MGQKQGGSTDRGGKGKQRTAGPRCDESGIADIYQVSLLTAADFWRTKAITPKGVPAVKTSDGPNGARGGVFVGGTKVSLASFKTLLLLEGTLTAI